MNRATAGIAVLLATALPHVGHAQALEEAQKPPTALDREENNPAKAAARVSEALKKEEAGDEKDISVSTHADIVVVTGEVGSEAAAAKAKAAAEAAAKPTRVTTDLEVREGAQSPASAGTARLAQAVQDALRKDKRTAHLGVAVTVEEEGRIGLHGLVPTRQNRADAESVARKAAGAARISNRLEVPAG